MNNLYLVGFMGTGKTVVGKKLSARLGRKFVDLDDCIVKRYNRSIADIFNTEGEVFFRGLETDMLREIAQEDKCIVACGGGAVIAEANRVVMKKTGTIVCLTADPETIFTRTAVSSRPLLQTRDPKRTIVDLLAQRQPFYAQADMVVDTARKSIDQVVGEITAVFSENT
jgi:shikimate kinase